MIKRIMIYSGLIMLIGISVWMLYHNQSSTKGLKIQPNTIIYNIHAKNFDKTGALASQFYTPKLTHYNKDNESRFLSPKVIFYQNKKKPWVITSDYGKAIANNTKIILWQHVILQQAQSKKDPQTIIKTSKLTFYPKKGFAITHEHVTMIEERNHKITTRIAAVGAKFYQKNGEIQLLSRARGTYVPSK